MLAIARILKIQDRGFTLIELLVVITIVGILSGLALPTLINQVHKAKEAEAKQNLGVCSRFQQAYYQENAKFADTIEKLESAIPYETNNYKYSIIVEPFNDSENNLKTLACCMADAKIPGIETYLQCNTN